MRSNQKRRESRNRVWEPEKKHDCIFNAIAKSLALGFPASYSELPARLPAAAVSVWM